MNEMIYAGQMLAVYDSFRNTIGKRESFEVNDVGHAVRVMWELNNIGNLPNHTRKFIDVVGYSCPGTKMRDLHALAERGCYDVEAARKEYDIHCIRIRGIISMHAHKTAFGMDMESFCRAIDDENWVILSQALTNKRKMSIMIAKAAVFADGATDEDIYFGLIHEKLEELKNEGL